MQEILKKQRKHSKRIWALLLCFILLIGIMPTTAFAATEVTTVDVSDIALPAAGETPDYEGTLPSGANYHFASADELRNLGWTDLEIQGLTNGVRWETASYSLLSSTDRFEAEKEYYFAVALLPNSGYTFSNNPNATLNGSADIVWSTYIDRGVLLVFSKDLKATGQASVTMEIPISMQVFQHGKNAPGAQTFAFEVAPYGNPQADISGLTITGAKISTDGAGNYTGTLKIVGDPDVIDNARGLEITEKNDGAANWTYDDATYIVYRDTGNGMEIQKDMGANMNPQSVQSAEFINTYTKNSGTTTDPANPGQDTNKDDTTQTTSPKTGDNSNMLLWLALMIASCGGIITTFFFRKKRVRAK